MKGESMKHLLMAVGIILLIFVSACLMALNVKSGYTTLIRIDNQEQYEYIIKGKEPIINFVSLRDTPYAEEVKILKIRYHTTTKHLFSSSKVVSEWLGEIGVRHYPELVRP